MREVIVTGKTVEEATELACSQLGLSREEVSVEILELPTRKLFKTTPAKVRAVAENDEPETELPQETVKPVAPAAVAAPAAQPEANAETQPKAEPVAEEEIEISANPKLAAAVEYLTTVFAAMGAGHVTVRAVKQGEAIIVKVEGEDVGVLIGHRGETMESLSYLAGLVANRMEGDYMKLGLDVAGYRGKREKDLEALARRIGAKVAKTGRSHAMDPMNPYERRIIHAAIGEMEGVRSESKGEGAERRVIIYSTDPNARQNDRGPRRSAPRDNRGGYNRGGAPRREGGAPRRDAPRDNRGGYNKGGQRSSVPTREFADAPRTEGAAPVAPKRTQLIDDAEGFALYGKIQL